MIRNAVKAVVVLTCVFAVLGLAGAASAVDAPRWVAAMYVEQQKMIGLRWMPVPGATGYKVFRTVTAGKDQQEIASTTTPQHLDSAIEPGTTYFYSLKALAGAETSPASDEKSVVIPGVKKSGVETPELESVALQTAMEFGKTTYKVGIFWRGKGSAIAYNLYRSLQAGKPGEMISSSQDQRYIDVAVEPGKTYYYTVSALDAAFQETKPSAERSVEVKAPEVAAAGPAAVKKVMAKLIPIPTAKGELHRLTSSPFDMAIDSRGQVYIAGDRLYLYDGDKIVDKTPEGYESVLNVGIGLEDQVLVTVLNSDKSLVITGAKVQEIVLPPMTKQMDNGDGKMIPIQPPRPVDILQNIDSKFWITDNSNNRVMIFGEDRVFITTAGAGTPQELVQNATNLGHDSKGNVFVSNGALNSIVIFDKNGKYVGTFGETGNVAGTFGRVGGIFVDKKDNVWVTDMFNNTVQKFDITGVVLGALSSPDKTGNIGVTTPNAIVLDDKGKKGFITQGITKSFVEITILE